MSLKTWILALASAVAFAWIGLSAPAATAAPTSAPAQLTKLSQESGLHAKKKHKHKHKKGKKHHKKSA